MERHVKERLVGAAVLMAAAIILIPEMLSGPDRAVREPAQRTPGEGPLKTYTIDLQQSQEGASASATIDERAPPPEQITPEVAAPAPEEPATASQVNPERVAQEERAGAETSASATTPAQSALPAPAHVEETPTPARAAPPKRDLPASAASSPATSTSGGWAVQIGSFSKQATAERLVGELRAAGHAAFVMPVRSGAGSLHRVRVGPFDDRASAEAALRNLKARASGAAVVAHP